MPLRICFVSDKHDAYDDRIYWKLALSLKEESYEVSHVCAFSQKEEHTSVDGVHIIPYLTPKLSRTQRYLRTDKSFNFLLDLEHIKNADLIILSDINVLSLVSELKTLYPDKKIIYDVHDPFYINIKSYTKGTQLKKWFWNFHAEITRKWELKVLRQVDGIVATEENWENYFKNNLKSVPTKSIHNYPIFEQKSTASITKDYDLIYTGSMSAARGLFAMIEVMNELVNNRLQQITLLLIGTIHQEEEAKEAFNLITKFSLSENIIIQNVVPHEDIPAYYNKSKIGLALFQDLPNHHIILPIKLFEYMNFGLPIVGTSIGHIQKVVNKNNCGATVSIGDIKNAADHIDKLLNNKDLYSTCSINGIKAVDKKHHWKLEKPHFLNFCKRILQA